MMDTGTALVVANRVASNRGMSGADMAAMTGRAAVRSMADDVLPTVRCGRVMGTVMWTGRMAMMVAVMRPKYGREVRPSVIEWAAGIIIVPVRAEREGHDRHVDPIEIIRQINVPVVVEVIEIGRAYPAAVAAEGHVTPISGIQASVDVNACIVRNCIDYRILCARTGVHMNRTCRVAARRPRRCRRGDYQDGCGEIAPLSQHEVSPLIDCCIMGGQGIAGRCRSLLPGYCLDRKHPRL